MRNRIPLGLGDILVATFIVVLVGAAGMVRIQSSRDAAEKLKCASNLRQLGLAVLLYQNDNQQAFPRTVADNVDDPKPVWGTPYQSDPKLGADDQANAFDGGKYAPAPNDVTSSLFLLLRTEDLTSGVFLCPATNLRPWNFGGAKGNSQGWTNWQGNSGLAKHLSYSFQNPFVSKAAELTGYQMKTPDPTFAVMADMNPGGDAETSLSINSANDQMLKGNSLNHQREGQNVLYGDGHVEWQTHPFCGTQHDNIYTAAGPEIQADERKTAVIAASAVSTTDSILLPTALDIGYKLKPPGKPLTAEEREKLKASMQGDYIAAVNGVDATLKIDDKTIKYPIENGVVEYQYEAIGGSGDTLVIKLNPTDTTRQERATMEVDEEGQLQFTTTHDRRLDFSWKRVKPNPDGK